MTYKEAKKIFETLEVQVPLGCSRDFQVARELAIEALKKQIPTKPNWIYNDEPLCPYCQEVIEDLKVLTGLQRKRKYYNKFVKEVWQKEHGKLSYPDFDEIYKRYFEQQAEIERLKYNLKAVLDERADHSEAIEEFADRVVEQLKESSKTYCEEYGQRENTLYLWDAIEIVKESGKGE